MLRTVPHLEAGRLRASASQQVQHISSPVLSAMKEPEAETHWLDQHRDPTEAAVVWSLAAQVVAQHGGDLRGMRRALGISNATWVGGGLAVRIANTPVVDGMAAEVA